VPNKGKPRFTGKVAIVTGAGRGIGRMEALLLAREGAKVVVNDLGGASGGGGADASIARLVVDEIKAAGGEAVAETSSIGSMEGGRNVVRAAIEAFGRLDILINNAGITRPLRIDETDEEAWDTIHNVNLKGTFATIREAAPIFIDQGSGVILNTSSPSGYGQYSNTAYGAAKEGIIGLTRSVARDLGAHGVRCNAIRPRAANSQMVTPKMIEVVEHSEQVLGIPVIWNRWSAPANSPNRQESVAAAAVWLCSDACAEVIGREFFVAGAEFGILPEPELQRTIFNAGGWDLDSLDAYHNRTYLIGDVRNRFNGKRDAL
jgi:NAD(P)-dependent dehydrogenase (short-subunit alcohol dehydrogenase family)